MAKVTFTVVALEPPEGGYGAWESKPVSAATVKVSDIMRKAEEEASCTTNSQGQCSITLAEGAYICQAFKTGYKPYSGKTHDFAEEGTVRLHLDRITPKIDVDKPKREAEREEAHETKAEPEGRKLEDMPTPSEALVLLGAKILNKIREFWRFDQAEPEPSPTPRPTRLTDPYARERAVLVSTKVTPCPVEGYCTKEAIGYGVEEKKYRDPETGQTFYEGRIVRL